MLPCACSRAYDAVPLSPQRRFVDASVLARAALLCLAAFGKVATGLWALPLRPEEFCKVRRGASPWPWPWPHPSSWPQLLRCHARSWVRDGPDPGSPTPSPDPWVPWVTPPHLLTPGPPHPTGWVCDGRLGRVCIHHGDFRTISEHPRPGDFLSRHPRRHVDVDMGIGVGTRHEHAT